MKQLFPALFLLFVGACGQKSPAIRSGKVDSVKIAEPVAAKDSAMDEVNSTDEESGTFYVVEVARALNYDSLKVISTNTASLLGTKLNMLDRIYKSGKGIIVPEDSDDELYRGEYFPRRPFEDQNFVSIEMSNGFIDNNADTLEMVVIAGIYSLQSQADSVASLLKDKMSTVKTVKQEMFLGCMH
ncbi:hypothetical protein [Longitalea luteola]|uniref:hypothetical protein n=1 Tax=Longitalea luteola TaxID=2812563 RepID=UPI001A9747B9|nr:hypothetical protein [Longitalea luteola]